MGNKKILVLDDDPITQKILQKALMHDYELNQCETLLQAREAILKDSYDLFIIDRVLPDGDGLDLCRQIRANEAQQDTPIIFLSGCTTESDKVISLLTGGTDYVTKPFGILELKTRVAIQLKSSSQRIFSNNLELDLESFTAKSKDGLHITYDLTPLEFKLLVTFVKNKDKVLNRQDILNQVWGSNLNISDRVVDTHISQLRKKLDTCKVVFESYRGEGYKFKDAA